MKKRSLLALWVLSLPASQAGAQSVLFDFDSTPYHTPLPIDLTVGDITASFSGTAQGYSIQLANISGIGTPAGFSGNCIYPNSSFASDLLVSFSQALRDASIMYAPSELGCDTSATMRITGYRSGTFVATSTATAPVPGTWPTGVLTLSAPQGFDSVVIHYDAAPSCETAGPIFVADNLTVTPLPMLSIDDVAVAEGNTGTTTLGFTVSLSAMSDQTVTVDYATADGTATTADSDYVTASGTLSFAPGVTTQPVSVTVNGDSRFEADETFSVNLTNSSGGPILDAQGLGTILNDDSSSRTLTVVRAGLGSGQVSSTPSGISCGLDCTEVYAGGTLVQLAATPDPGSVLVGWFGGCVGTALTCDVTMDAPKTVTALFDLAGEPITWERLFLTEVVGTVLRRPTGSGWNAGAVSSKVIASGDGYVEYALPATAGYAMFGLSHGDTDGSYADIDFALFTYPPTGQLMVFETGVYRGTFGTYAGGDRLRVSVEGGVVTYRRNGQLLGTSAVLPTYPLLADTSLYSAGTELLDGRIAGLLEDRILGATEVSWRNAVRASATGSTLTRESSVGWNGGASSSQELAAGDGYAEFRVADLTSCLMFGLSHGDTDQGYADVDYGLLTYPGTGQVMAFEGGLYRATLGTYGVNDVLRVGVEGGVVTYAVNGTILYTSSTPPTYPLVTDTSLYSSGAKVQNATMGGDLKEIVTWTHLNEVVVGADALTRPVAGGWTAGAISSRRIASGNGGAEYRVSTQASYVMFGLSHGDTDAGYADIDYALFTYAATGQVMVFEGGAYRGTFGSYSAGDVLAVRVEGGGVSYRRNGALLYSSSVAPVFPLVLDVSLYWGRVEGARLFGNLSSVPEQAVTWSNLVNVTDSAGTLRRPAGYGWDAGAVSAQTLAGDGYAEYTVSSASDYVMFGLGKGDSDQGYADIEYAIFTYPGTGLYVFEAGVYRAAGGTYAAGDQLRVSVEGGSVKYRKNGALLYGSTAAPSYPLNVDTSLYSPGATVAGAKVGREE